MAKAKWGLSPSVENEITSTPFDKLHTLVSRSTFYDLLLGSRLCCLSPNELETLSGKSEFFDKLIFKIRSGTMPIETNAQRDAIYDCLIESRMRKTH